MLPIISSPCVFPVLLPTVVPPPVVDEPLLSGLVVVVVPPPVVDEPLLSVDSPVAERRLSLLSVDSPVAERRLSLLSVVCPLAYIIAEVGKTIEITIKNINEIVILFIVTTAVTNI